MRILIRGGSIAAGRGVNRGYADRLRDHYAARGIGVLNHSRPNDNSFDGIWSFRDDIEPYRPDLLILHFGTDDAFLPVYRSEFKENLVQIVRLARARFNPAVVLLTSHAFEDPHEMEAMNIYYRAIREVSADLACDMIPIHTYWQGYVEENGLRGGDLVQPDARYPNEAGHAVYAAAIISRLETMLPTGENS